MQSPTFAPVTRKKACFSQPPRSPCFSPKKSVKWDHKQNFVYSKMMNEMNNVFMQKNKKIEQDEKVEIDLESGLILPSEYSKFQEFCAMEKDEKYKDAISAKVRQKFKKDILNRSLQLNVPLRIDWNQDQKEQVAFEILTTECSYVDQIDIIMEDVIRWLKAYSVSSPCKILKETQIQAFFGNISDIAKLHHKLLNQMIQVFQNGGIRAFEKEIPMILLKFAPFFKIYFHYVNSFALTQEKLSQERNNNIEFGHFLDAFESIHKASIFSFLIVPVQRIPRYKLLLHRMKESCSNVFTEQDEQALRNIETGLNKIEKIAEEIESMMKVSEARLKVVQLQEQVFKSKVTIVRPTRYCVRVGILGTISNHHRSNLPKNMMFILFNDSMICCSLPDKAKPSEIKYEFSIEHTIINSISEKKDLENSFCFISPNAFLTVIAQSAAEKDDWISDFKSTVSKFMQMHAGLRSEK
jgi:hypothetical protein